jgi:hypothetical protein
MINRIFFSLITLFAIALRIDAAMVRVIGVTDGQTLVVERRGIAVNIKLAGISVTDDAGARTLLKWTAGSAWVMLEEQADGGHFVYRSPDALFLNRELVARGFARATMQAIEPPSNVVVTYLGTMSLGVRGPAAAARSPKAGGTGNAPTPRSPARPSRPRRPRKP